MYYMEQGSHAQDTSIMRTARMNQKENSYKIIIAKER